MLSFITINMNSLLFTLQYFRSILLNLITLLSSFAGVILIYFDPIDFKIYITSEFNYLLSLNTVFIFTPSDNVCLRSNCASIALSIPSSGCLTIPVKVNLLLLTQRRVANRYAISILLTL